MEIDTKNAQETKALGRKLSAAIEGKRTVTFALVGGLGAGKTTFVQGLADGLGIVKRINSPTFMLMRKYDIPARHTHKHLYHLDLYRIDDNAADALEALGMKDVWEEDGNIVVVEWAEKMQDFAPPNTVWISFEGEGEKRHIKVAGRKE